MRQMKSVELRSQTGECIGVVSLTTLDELVCFAARPYEGYTKTVRHRTPARSEGSATNDRDSNDPADGDCQTSARYIGVATATVDTDTSDFGPVDTERLLFSADLGAQGWQLILDPYTDGHLCCMPLYRRERIQGSPISLMTFDIPTAVGSSSDTIVLHVRDWYDTGLFVGLLPPPPTSGTIIWENYFDEDQFLGLLLRSQRRFGSGWIPKELQPCKDALKVVIGDAFDETVVLPFYYRAQGPPPP